MSPAFPETIERHEPLPSVIHGYLPVRSEGDKSILDYGGEAFPESVEAFRSNAKSRREATTVAESAGLEVVAESSFGLAVRGESGAYEELTGGRLVTTERMLHAEAGRRRYVTHIDVVGKAQPKACGHGIVHSKDDAVEGVLIERPRLLHGVYPTPLPPLVDKNHLNVPDDVALALGAERAHREGVDGDGAVVAMVDSGQFPHPFFDAQGYEVQETTTVVPGTSPTEDPVGHGTGESSNIFAVAPGATLKPYRASNNRGRLVGAIAAFLMAKEGKPDVLTNSWGGDGPFPPPRPPDSYDWAWALEIYDAIQEGIFVVFSAGNGQFSIEPQVPGVLAAGGAHVDNALDVKASNYASGYASPWFNLTVPDVCGLVGELPRAQYLMLPIPPGCEIDVSESQPFYGDSPDGTPSNDGWALFSGTSAAAPQVAGAAALVLSAKPGLKPSQVTEALKATAVDIRVGHCHPRFNFAAQIGHDSATGHGLVDASGAVQYARDTF
jgi:subtilisin family serine protease